MKSQAKKCKEILFEQRSSSIKNGLFERLQTTVVNERSGGREPGWNVGPGWEAAVAAACKLRWDQSQKTLQNRYRTLWISLKRCFSGLQHWKNGGNLAQNSVSGKGSQLEEKTKLGMPGQGVSQPQSGSGSKTDILFYIRASRAHNKLQKKRKQHLPRGIWTPLLFCTTQELWRRAGWRGEGRKWGGSKNIQWGHATRSDYHARPLEGGGGGVNPGWNRGKRGTKSNQHLPSDTINPSSEWSSVIKVSSLLTIFPKYLMTNSLKQRDYRM